jgi:predicted negative regulator of RcsB-dependent stress response
MAALDLEQQEQLDQFKRVWQKFGNLIIWTITLCLLAYAGWTWYQHQLSGNALKDAGLYEALDVRVQQGDMDKAAAVFADMQSQYPSATYTVHGALLLAQAQAARGQSDAAIKTLTWLKAQKLSEVQSGLAAIAKLRLSGLLFDAGKNDEALAMLDGAVPEGFETLVEDRRGDIYSAKGETAKAIAAYKKAYASVTQEGAAYKSIIAVKLTSLGVDPNAS